MVSAFLLVAMVGPLCSAKGVYIVLFFNKASNKMWQGKVETESSDLSSQRGPGLFNHSSINRWNQKQSLFATFSLWKRPKFFMKSVFKNETKKQYEKAQELSDKSSKERSRYPRTQEHTPVDSKSLEEYHLDYCPWISLSVQLWV